MNISKTSPHSLSPLAGRVLATLVDPTIVLSFDRTGYWIHSATFQAADVDVNLRGRNCLVTGATSGLGFETAKALAEREAEVWMLCRNADRGHSARDRILQAIPSARLHVEVLDISSLASVRQFCARFTAQRVDVLVHNAGVLPAERKETAEGLELTWATNVVGPFLLTNLLLPKLHAAQQARVITVSSGGMYLTRLSLKDIESRRGNFSGVKAYAQTKRAAVVLNELWAEHLGSSGIRFFAMHPGWVDTPGIEAALPGFHKLIRNRLRTPTEGADTIVWLALCERILGSQGRFWFDRQPRLTHLLPWTRESTADRRALWKLCCQQAGLD